MYTDEIAAYEPFGERDESDKRVILEYIRLFPHNILTRENEFAHITSSGLILNRELTKVLMIYHNIFDTWAWTGGHADGEGDLLAIAMKEAREETGLASLTPLTERMLSLDILPVCGHRKNGRWVSAHMHLNSAYVLIADERDALRVKPDENSGVEWFPVEELKTRVTEEYFPELYGRIVERARRA